MAKKKYKHMTAKEFKEAFEKLYGSFEIWQWDGILNCLACLARYEAEQMARLNCQSSARREQKRHDDILEYLMNRGYYFRDKA